MYPVGYTLLRDNQEYVEREDEFDKEDEDGVPVPAIVPPSTQQASVAAVDSDAELDVGSAATFTEDEHVIRTALPLIVETKRQRKKRKRVMAAGTS
jgi:hypothetical protein